MLGSEVLAVRLGGIYALAGLAREDPEDYHTKIMRLLCGFVRHPVGKPVEAASPLEGLTPAAEFNSGWDEAGDEDREDRPLRVREDVQTVMTAVGERSEAQIKTEEGENYRLDLRDAKLKSVRLVDADLNHANLPNADLTVLPPSSVGEMTLRLYGALSYSQNSARDLRCALNRKFQ